MGRLSDEIARDRLRVESSGGKPPFLTCSFVDALALGALG